MKKKVTDVEHLLDIMTRIGVALSREHNHQRLLELILVKAQEITNADGGTIYSLTENNTLKFEILINRSMGIHLGGTRKKINKFADLPLYDAQGLPNNHMLAPWAAISKKTIRIDDAYRVRKFDLSGTKKFDRDMGYHSQSFIIVPMTNHLDEVIGVLQLINASDEQTGEVIAFSSLHQHIVESLASQAAVAITNQKLINDQRNLFDSLIQLIAKAIDEKSPYTGSHCRRVPIITRMIADAACRISYGPLRDFHLNEEEFYELEVAAWLHDCGKITVPESVVDKATKLETIMDGVVLIDSRYEIIKRDNIIRVLQDKIKSLCGTKLDLKTVPGIQAEEKKLDDECLFIHKINMGGEQISPEDIARLKQIAQRRWQQDNSDQPFLSAQELQMLQIHRGTLTSKERCIINNHVNMTIKMLESLPYPKNLQKVPKLAGAHHEKLNGSGYPYGLTAKDLTVSARMIALADIFEALTAGDRPYKKAMTLQQALTILGQMKLDGEIDPDLFNLFIHEKIYRKYANAYLPGSRDQTVDEQLIPGYENPQSSASL